MRKPIAEYFFAVSLSVALHAVVLLLVGTHMFHSAQQERHTPEETIVYLETLEPPEPEPATDLAPPPMPLLPVPAVPPLPAPAVVSNALESAVSSPEVSDRQRPYMEAPPAPSAQDWALASTYKLKNSKRYRHTWGQQVRSMMGTAYEGPDQGAVRFRVEIAPDGRLTRLDTLWSTSPVAERLARQAMQNMPSLPPTPTGEPLIFEKTISFQPFAADDTPIYKNDCLPDRPAFRNPYAWDGKSAQGPALQPTSDTVDALALEECLQQLPEDSVEAESAHDRRQLEQWRSGRLGP